MRLYTYYFQDLTFNLHLKFLPEEECIRFVVAARRGVPVQGRVHVPVERRVQGGARHHREQALRPNRTTTERTNLCYLFC